MGLILFPRSQIENTSGKPYSGALAYFYAPGTTTPITVYTTAALTTPLSNPVVADASGIFPAIFAAVDYKILIKDSVGNTIYTNDNLSPLSLSSGSTIGAASNIAATPLDFGAVGDGVANEAAAVQAAIDSKSTGGTIDLAGKTYRCDTAIILRSNNRLINGTLNFSACTQTPCLSMTGALASGVSMTVSGDPGANTLTFASTTGFAAGDWLLVSASDVWSTGVVGGEFVRVKAVTSATVLTLDAPIYGKYSSSPNVRKLTPIVNTSIEDVRLIGGQNTTQRGFEALYSIGISIKNLRTEDFYTAGIRFTGCVNSSAQSCTVVDSNNGDGFVFEGCQDFVATVCRAEYALASGFKLGEGTVGINRHVHLEGCSANGAGVAGFWLNSGSQYCSVVSSFVNGNTSLTTEKGIIDYGTDNQVKLNSIRNTSTYGIEGNSKRTLTQANVGGTIDANMLSITGNKIEYVGTATAGIYVNTTTSSLPMRGVDVCGNSIEGSMGRAIHIDVDHLVNNVRVDGNRTYGILQDNIFVDVAASSILTRLSVSGNICADPGASSAGIRITSVDASGVTQGVVANNVITGGTNSIVMEKADYIVVSGNVCNSPTALALDINDCDYCQIIGNIIIGGTRSIDVFSSDFLTIQGNRCTSCTLYGIYIDTCNPCSIIGNTVNGNNTVTADLSVISSTTVQVKNNTLLNEVIITSTGVTLALLDFSGNSISNANATFTLAATTLANIVNNTIIAGTATAISITFSAAIGQLRIDGNECSSNIDAGVILVGGSASVTVTMLSVSKNNLRQLSSAAGSTGVSVQANNSAFTRAEISGNILEGGVGSILITIPTSSGSTSFGIKNNTAPKGISFSGSAVEMSVRGNDVTDGVISIGCAGLNMLSVTDNSAKTSGVAALLLSLGVADIVSIKGNTLQATGTEITDGVISVAIVGSVTVGLISVIGNTLRNTALFGSCILMAGASATITRLFISSNICRGGLESIRTVGVSAITVGVASGNMLSAWASAAFNGSLTAQGETTSGTDIPNYSAT